MISEYERNRNVVNIEDLYNNGLSIARITETFTRESPYRAFSTNKHNVDLYYKSLSTFENKGRRICRELNIDVPQDFLDYVEGCRQDPKNSVYLDGKSNEMENHYDNTNVRLDHNTINTRRHFYENATARTKNH